MTSLDERDITNLLRIMQRAPFNGLQDAEIAVMLKVKLESMFNELRKGSEKKEGEHD